MVGGLLFHNISELTRTPETKEEIQAARRAANAISVEEPWQEAEHEAGEDIKTGRVKIFESADDLFKDWG